MNEPPNSALIQLENIWRSYELGPETVHALRGVNLRVARGEYVAIIGPSGSGKSTLMNIIGCLDTPSQGEYILNGQVVSEMEDHDLARVRNEEIGFIFQTFNLLSRLTAQRNVELPLVYGGVPPADRVQRATEALQIVGLAQRRRHRPNEMSGGQNQRVAVARALVTKPSILLADEPTGNLDTATGIEILKLFAEIHAMGNTIILVTHNPEVAEHAQRVVSILDGAIAEDRPGTKVGQ